MTNFKRYSLEVEAIQSFSNRWVGVIRTAKGVNIHSIMCNPDIVNLVGGLTRETVGDAKEKLQKREKQNSKRIC